MSKMIGTLVNMAHNVTRIDSTKTITREVCRVSKKATVHNYKTCTPAPLRRSQHYAYFSAMDGGLLNALIASLIVSALPKRLLLRQTRSCT